MRFTFDNVTYLIEFERQPRVIASRWVDPETGEEHDAVVDKYHPQTTATIFKVTETDDPKKPHKEVFRTYTVKTNHRDTNNLDTGRKMALRKAMYDAPEEHAAKVEGRPDDRPLRRDFTRLSREFRIAVWTAYFNRADWSKAQFEKTLKLAQAQADAN